MIRSEPGVEKGFEEGRLKFSKDRGADDLVYFSIVRLSLSKSESTSPPKPHGPP